MRQILAYTAMPAAAGDGAGVGGAGGAAASGAAAFRTRLARFAASTASAISAAPASAPATMPAMAPPDSFVPVVEGWDAPPPGVTGTRPSAEPPLLAGSAAGVLWMPLAPPGAAAAVAEALAEAE